jgi:hypothetical protein
MWPKILPKKLINACSHCTAINKTQLLKLAQLLNDHSSCLLVEKSGVNPGVMASFHNFFKTLSKSQYSALSCPIILHPLYTPILLFGPT